MTSTVDVAIIGGGISGLSAAYRISQQTRSVALLESTNRLGGVLSTEVIGARSYETAAAGFLDRDANGAAALADELGVSLREARPAATKRWIFKAGALRQIPMSPIGLLRSDLLSTSAKLRLLLEPFIRSGHGEETVHGFACRRFGHEVADDVVVPFVAGIFAGDARSLTLDAFPTLAALDGAGGVLRGSLRQRRAAGKNSGSLSRGLCSPEAGMGSLISALAAQIQGEYRLEFRVLDLDIGDGRIAVVGEGGTVHARSVVVACDAHTTADLIAKVDPRGSAMLRDIPYVPITVCHLVYPREQVAHPLDGFGFLVREGEEVDILGCVFDSSVWARGPEDMVQLRCLLGGYRKPGVVDWSDEEVIDASIRAMSRALAIESEPVETRVVRWPRAIPQYHIGHTERVASVSKRLEASRIILSGSAIRGVSVNDCVASGSWVARKVAELLAILAIFVSAGCSTPSASTTTQLARSDGGKAAAAATSARDSMPSPQIAPATGAVEIEVRWSPPPATLVRSRGSSECGGLRRSWLSVHHTGGVRNAVVVLLGEPDSKSTTPRVILSDCKIDPFVTVVGAGTEFADFANLEPRSVDAAMTTPSGRQSDIFLRLMGEEARLPLPEFGLYRLDNGSDRGVGYLYRVDKGVATTTNALGVAVFDSVSAGSHEVLVVHPPVAAGGRPVVHRGDVVVEPGGTVAHRVSMAL